MSQRSNQNRARSLIRRMEFCYTPKHGSWLNIAENELSSLTRQCVADRRFADVATLQGETAAWSTDVTATQRGVDWQMKIDDARTKLNGTDREISANFDRQASATNSVLFPWSLPNESEQNRLLLCFVPPRSAAVRNLVPRFDRASNRAGFTTVVLGCRT